MPSPTLTLEPHWTYLEASEALGVSLSLIQKECAANRLPHRRKGRYCYVTQADVDVWWQGQYERTQRKQDKARFRADQKPPKRREMYVPEVDADIAEALGLIKK